MIFKLRQMLAEREDMIVTVCLRDGLTQRGQLLAVDETGVLLNYGGVVAVPWSNVATLRPERV